MDRRVSSVVDIPQLARRMSELLERNFVSAKLLDRGAYATVYHLIDDPSSSDSTENSGQPAVVVRVSSRPLYHDVAIDEERQKIRVYVATVNAIHASAPKQVKRRVPRVLAYDASSNSEFGHGWIAMTRMAGSSLAECWMEFRPSQRRHAIEELARFTRKVARSRVSGEISSIAETASSSAGRSRAANAFTAAYSYATAPLSLPRRNGANNLRPFNKIVEQHLTTASFLANAVENEIEFLRQHQKPAIRCFNMNMLRLQQCGMDTEIPVDADFGSTTSGSYKRKLRTLGEFAQGVMENSMESKWEPERFVFAHLDVSPENVLVDPETGDLMALVDWEFAGFIPDWLALAPPSWVSNEYLPTWTSKNGWSMDEQDNEENPFGPVEEADEILELQELREAWLSEVAWDDQDVNINASTSKRMAWKACLSEWHQLERACAWARGMSSTMDHTGPCDSDSVWSDSDVTSSETDHSPSTVQSSIGLDTPARVPSSSLPSALGKLGLSLVIDDDESSEEEDDDDEEDDDASSTEEYVQDDDFEAFAAAFSPPPLPHCATPHPTPTLLITTPSPSMEAPLQAFKSPPSRGRQLDFASSMNSNSPPSGSRWCVFWEAPKEATPKDLDFVLERDFDAGW